MSYPKRYPGGFVDLPSKTTPVDSQFLNAVEDALLKLFGVAPVTNGALVWDGTEFTAASLIKDAQIDAAAAIAKSKLAALQIGVADLAAGVGVAVSGCIMQFAGATAPSGWFLCDGSAVSRTGANAALFTAIGTAYGVGDGSTTFNLPDLRGRVPVGLSTGGASIVNALGKNDGVAANLRSPSHHHSYDGPTGGAAFANTGNSVSATITSTSGDGNNADTPAYVVVNYIIKS